MNHSELKALVLSKHGNHCGYCGEELSTTWHLDHVVPKSKGGRWNVDNLIPACQMCNLRKNCMDNAAYKDYLTKKLAVAIAIGLEEFHRMQTMLDEETARQISEALEIALGTAQTAEVSFYFER